MTEIKRDPVELTVPTKDANDHYVEVLDNLLKDLNEVAWCGDLLKVFGSDIYRVKAFAEMLKADLEECVDEEIEVLDLADVTQRELKLAVVKNNRYGLITRKAPFEIKTVLMSSRNQAYHAVNFSMVQAYWNIGRIIVEHEQMGKL